MKTSSPLSSDPLGILVVDKPLGMTSHDVVSRARRIAKTRRVGHAGTLDPDASGVLVLGIGRATKLLGYIAGTSKEYLATIRLGISTTTDDAEGQILEANGVLPGIISEIEGALVGFRGNISQVPSTISAIKVDGKRAYARARAGETVELKARPVTIDRFEIVENGSEDPMRETLVDGVSVIDVDVIVECSTGTYIRALARDLGKELGVGAHLVRLRRTRVGPWSIGEATPLDDLMELAEEQSPLPLVSVDEAAARVFEIVLVSAEAGARFMHGGAPDITDVIDSRTDILKSEGAVFALTAQDKPGVVLGLVRVEDGRFRTQIVLVTHQPSSNKEQK